MLDITTYSLLIKPHEKTSTTSDCSCQKAVQWNNSSIQILACLKTNPNHNLGHCEFSQTNIHHIYFFDDIRTFKSERQPRQSGHVQEGSFHKPIGSSWRICEQIKLNVHRSVCRDNTIQKYTNVYSSNEKNLRFLFFASRFKNVREWKTQVMTEDRRKGDRIHKS